MKVTTCIKVLVWFIVFMLLLTVATKMMTAQNTIEAIAGLVLVVLFILLSYKSLFFTRFYIKHTKLPEGEAEIEIGIMDKEPEKTEEE